MKKYQENQLHIKQIGKEDKSNYDLIPYSIKGLPREQKPLTIPEHLNSEYTPPKQEIKLFPIWPGDEEARVCIYNNII